MHVWLLLSCATHRPPVAAAPPPVTEEPAPVGPDLVPVAVPREFRGLWVATVVNLDFPSRAGLSADEATAELRAIAQTAQDRGINALVLQVRSESDALYPSTLEPWSRYLTGHQGGDPGFDPLQTLIDEAHTRGIEVHAWFNPYRAAASRGSPTAENHVTRWAHDAVAPWGHTVWMDPGAKSVQDHTLAVIDDVVTRYDVDGVHLDDYFYPYPDGGRAFPDQRSWAAYQRSGGTLDRNAWRASNVDGLVSQIAAHVAERRPDCVFGISPFGIYHPGEPEGIRGMDPVIALHADPLLWYRNGWVDYLAPQLYWSTHREAQRYDRLLAWWDTQVTADRPLLVGIDLTRVGTTEEWGLDELRTEVGLARAAPNTRGEIWFRAAPVLKNQAGVGDLLAELYASPALPPPKPGLAGLAAPPSAVPHPGGVTLADPDPGSLRAWVLYRAEADPPVAERILPPGTSDLPLPAGTWAVSAVRRGGLESLAVRFAVPPPM